MSAAASVLLVLAAAYAVAGTARLLISRISQIRNTLHDQHG